MHDVDDIQPRTTSTDVHFSDNNHRLPEIVNVERKPSLNMLPMDENIYITGNEYGDIHTHNYETDGEHERAFCDVEGVDPYTPDAREVLEHRNGPSFAEVWIKYVKEMFNVDVGKILSEGGLIFQLEGMRFGLRKEMVERGEVQLKKHIFQEQIVFLRIHDVLSSAVVLKSLEDRQEVAEGRNNE